MSELIRSSCAVRDLLRFCCNTLNHFGVSWVALDIELGGWEESVSVVAAILHLSSTLGWGHGLWQPPMCCTHCVPCQRRLHEPAAQPGACCCSQRWRQCDVYHSGGLSDLSPHIHCWEVWHAILFQPVIHFHTLVLKYGTSSVPAGIPSYTT